jgi:hypothetical protein
MCVLLLRPGGRALRGNPKSGLVSGKPNLAEVGMKRFTFVVLGLLLAVGLSLAAPGKDAKTFVGNIGDSMCGAKHTMGGSDKDCTLECVKKEGSKYILIDPSGKIYQLSDQRTPEQFAGAKVKVSGTLKGDTISVTSIVAAP